MSDQPEQTAEQAPEKKPKKPPPPWRTPPAKDAPEIELARWLLSLVPEAVEALWRVGDAEVAIRWTATAGGEGTIEWRTLNGGESPDWTKLMPLSPMPLERATRLVVACCGPEKPASDARGFRRTVDLVRAARAAGR